MVEAKCQNEDCDRDVWELTKHPNDYARGPNCPECGTSRVEVQGPAAAEPSQGGQTTQQAQPPAQTQQAPQQTAPATQQGGIVPSGEEAMGAGAQAGNLLAAANSDDPTERAAATGRGLKAFGSMLAQFGDHQERKAQQRNQRAKQANDSDIQVSQDYPDCPECGAKLTNLPAKGEEFRCHSCGTPLEHS